MLRICDLLGSNTLPTIVKAFSTPHHQYSKFFGGEEFKQEFKAAKIGLEKELAYIRQNRSIKQKYVLFDKEYRD